MDLHWRPGTFHQPPDALSRLPRFVEPANDIDDAFLDDATRERVVQRGHQGAVLDGVQLADLDNRLPHEHAAVFPRAFMSFPVLNVGGCLAAPSSQPDI